MSAEPACHKRKQQQRATARRLFQAVDALLATSAEVPSHLAAVTPGAVARIENHHGSEVPRRVQQWLENMDAIPGTPGWQTAQARKRRTWKWTTQLAEKYEWVACDRGRCKAWLPWGSFTTAWCACGLRWGGRHR